MLAKKCSKSFKLDYNSTWTKNFQMHKLYLQKAEEPDQIANICWFIEKKQGNSRKKKKNLLLLHLLCQSLWLSGSQKSMENS